MSSASPRTQVLSCPARTARRGETARAQTIIDGPIGRRLTAAISGLSPRTICMYWSIRNTKPKNAKNWTAIESVPAENARLVNSRGSSSGLARRSSQTTNPARTTSPAAIPAIVAASAQPRVGASMTEYTRIPRPATVIRAPV